MQLKAPIYLYYKLTNFYQNHRKYVKSLSYNQLHGDIISEAEAKASCAPIDVNPQGQIYYPCGLIANSMFNGKKKKSVFCFLMFDKNQIPLTMSPLLLRPVIKRWSRFILMKQVSLGPPTRSDWLQQRWICPRLFHHPTGQRDIQTVTHQKICFIHKRMSIFRSGWGRVGIPHLESCMVH